MISQFRRMTQVAILTCMLVFGTLLMVGSFEAPVWSDPHHGKSVKHKIHQTWFFFLYGGHETHQNFYQNGGHGNTSH